jgi:hypothetical protein
LLRIAFPLKRKIFTNQGNPIDNRCLLILTLRLEINSVRQSLHIAVFLSRSITTSSTAALRNSSSSPRTRFCKNTHRNLHQNSAHFNYCRRFTSSFPFARSRKSPCSTLGAASLRLLPGCEIPLRFRELKSCDWTQVRPPS